MTPRPTPYDDTNRRAALRILANPAADGISLRWAQEWLRAHPGAAPERQAGLFEAEAPKQKP